MDDDERLQVWVLKNTDDKYLSATYGTKFRHVVMGDLVPEQVYALRYWDRNTAAAKVVELNGLDVRNWRLIRLTTPKRSGA